MRTRILLVEDEATTSEPLAESLGRDGFEAEVTATLAGAREALRREAPDLVLLDVMLPDGGANPAAEDDHENDDDQGENDDDQGEEQGDDDQDENDDDQGEDQETTTRATTPAPAARTPVPAARTPAAEASLFDRALGGGRTFGCGRRSCCRLRP